MIRDRLVCANKSHDVIDFLVKEPDLTLAKAIAICLRWERAEESKRVLAENKGTNNDTKEEVHFVKGKRYLRKQIEQYPRKQIGKCFNCGSSHTREREACRAYGKQCRACKKMNHFAEYCITTKKREQHGEQRTDKPVGRPNRCYKPKYNRQNRQGIYEIEYQESSQSDGEYEHEYYPIDEIKCKEEIHATLTLDSSPVELKVDTGARCNVMPLQTLKQINPNKQINRSQRVSLVAYGGDTFKTVGTTTFQCDRNNNYYKLLFHVVDKEGQKTLLGLKDTIRLNLVKLSNDVHAVNIEKTPEIKRFPELFDAGIGKLPIEYRMTVDKSIEPVIRPPRRIPVAMKDDVKKELDRMLNMGIISQATEPTQWVSSMVAARKKNNEIRICIDPRDLNTALQRPRHPMRTIEEVTANMPRAKVFSILDAKNGFWHIPLSEQSKKLTCFNTPFGRYVFNRMPYGINSGSEVFQRSMEELFAGYPCEVIVDDMLIWGKDIEEHDGKLERVLKRASQINLKLNVAKCKFRVKQVTYVGHVLSEDGTHPDPAKIKAIINMPTPTEKQELQRFLGMINYISKFVENFSETTAPLRELLHNDVEWCWQDRHQKTFEALKRAITNPPVLAYYNVKKPVTLTCDASKSGLGAACLQEGRPVAYASRALTETEQNYAQIEKELLAVVFACKRFDDFVYGRPIEVETDHKPLVTILNKPLCAAPTRLQKMMLTLCRYNINITYKQGKELHIADALSRAYLPETKGGETTQYEVMTVFPISDTRKKQLQNAITTDTTSLQLTKLIQEGWPNTIKKVPKAARDFYPFRDELTVQDGMIVKGTRVIIPISLHQEYLTELHRGHPGAEGMKRRVNIT